MNTNAFLLINLAIAFYLIGAIWAVEVDIFRSWKLISAMDFHTVQSAHWRKLPYWVFMPLALALIGSIALVWYHPAHSPGWAILGKPSLPTYFARIHCGLLGQMASEPQHG